MFDCFPARAAPTEVDCERPTPVSVEIHARCAGRSGKRLRLEDEATPASGPPD